METIKIDFLAKTSRRFGIKSNSIDISQYHLSHLQLITYLHIIIQNTYLNIINNHIYNNICCYTFKQCCVITAAFI